MLTQRLAYAASPLKRVIALALSAALIAALIPLLSTPQEAYADSLDERVAETASAYDAAVNEQARLESEMATLDARIAELNDTLPDQKIRCAASIVSLYKYSNEISNVVMQILSSESLSDAINLIESYNWIISYNQTELGKTASMMAELETSKEQLKSDQADAANATQAAESALAEAQAARQEAQAKAAAVQAAEAEASSSSSSGASTTSSNQESVAAASSSHVDWSADKVAFVNEWAPRIDAYLSGSPTAGCGEAYAAAAWDYGVDPRWAPAISYVESSKGAACFRACNAWGFGSKSYSSWTEGINAITKSLGGSLYGGYLTMAAAQTYCPPNAQHWYDTCAEQMAMI